MLTVIKISVLATGVFSAAEQASSEPAKQAKPKTQTELRLKRLLNEKDNLETLISATRGNDRRVLQRDLQKITDEIDRLQLWENSMPRQYSPPPAKPAVTKPSFMSSSQCKALDEIKQKKSEIDQVGWKLAALKQEVSSIRAKKRYVAFEPMDLFDKDKISTLNIEIDRLNARDDKLKQELEELEHKAKCVPIFRPKGKYKRTRNLNVGIIYKRKTNPYIQNWWDAIQNGQENVLGPDGPEGYVVPKELPSRHGSIELRTSLRGIFDYVGADYLYTEFDKLEYGNYRAIIEMDVDNHSQRRRPKMLSKIMGPGTNKLRICVGHKQDGYFEVDIIQYRSRGSELVETNSCTKRINSEKYNCEFLCNIHLANGQSQTLTIEIRGME